MPSPERLRGGVRVWVLARLCWNCGISHAYGQPDRLSIAATSDDQQIVPDADLIIGGSGQSRSVTITPVPDVVGDAMITIVVTDPAGLSDGTSFLLTVDAEQQSMRQFTRDAFAESADDEAVLINAIEFAQDADDDDFADLLAQ